MRGGGGLSWRGARVARNIGVSAALAVVGGCLPVVTGVSSALPPGSAYEKVSPAAKGDGDVWFNYSTIRASPDGRRVAYHAPTGTDDDAAVMVPTEQIAVLQDDRWGTDHIMAPFADYGGAFIQTRLGFQAFSPDLTKGVLLSGFVALTPDADVEQRNLFRRDFATGATDLITPAPLVPLTRPAMRFASPVVAAVTSSLDRVFFEHVVQLTPDAQPASPICLSLGFGCANQAYEWARGRVRLVGILPGGTPAAGAVIGGGGGTAPTNQQRADRAVSSDGRQVIFTVPTTPAIGANGVSGDIYLRDGDADVTTPVTASQRTTPDPAGRRPATFLTAAVDGSRVLFKSCEKLTDESTADGGAGPACDPSTTKSDLYEYDVARARLTDLTATMSRRLEGLLGASDDASWAYVGVGTPGAYSLYRLHNGDATEITDALIGEDLENWPGGTSPRGSTVSDDGRYLVFTTRAAQHGADTGGRAQLFLYDALANTTRCISCLPGGGVARGSATLYSIQGGVTSGRPYLPRNIDDSGRYVFFESPDALAPQDVNGTRDVYRYEIATGAVTLVSTGEGEYDANFGDASADGRSVFFVTRNQVIPGLDRDALADLYVARDGAKAYEPPPEPRRCADDACQGALSAPLAGSTPGSATFEGPGDVDEAPPSNVERVFTLKPIGRRQLRAWARTGRLRLVVRVSSNGRVSAQARARLGRRQAVVARRSVSPHAGGIVRLTLRLSPAARRQLKRSGRLRVKVTVRYERGGPAQHRSLLLRKQPSKRASKRAVRSSVGASR